MDFSGEDVQDFGEGVFVVGLFEGHFTVGVIIMPEQVWKLFKNKDYPDGGEQTLNDASWEIG